MQIDAAIGSTKAFRIDRRRLNSRITAPVTVFAENTPDADISRDGSAAANGLAQVINITLAASAEIPEYSLCKILDRSSKVIIINALIAETLIPEKTIKAAIMPSQTINFRYFPARSFSMIRETNAVMVQTCSPDTAMR